MKSCIYISLFFFTFGLWAEGVDEEVFRHPLGPETLEAFKAVSGKLAEKPLVKGSFEQEKTISSLGRSLKASGNFIIAAELGMVWDTLHPFPSTLALGKDYLVQIRPGRQKMLVSAQGNETFIRLAGVISDVFSGNSAGLLNNFEVYYRENPAGWEIGLIPKDKAMQSFAVKIIMKGDTAIRSIFINEYSGGTIRYILSNHSYPSELANHEKTLFTLP